MEYSEFKKHFSSERSQELEKYLIDTVMLHSRYLFIKTIRGIQQAYCTHCKKLHFPESKLKLKHKQVLPSICPHCKSVCNVRASGISRKYMCDRGVFVWYEKSVVNPMAITARIISVYWDYSGDFREKKEKQYSSDEYLFIQGASYFFGGERLRKTVYSAFDKYYSGFSSTQRFMSTDNIAQAVSGTPFQYSTWEQYTRYENRKYVSDMVDFFDLAARYPCVEYLTKLGFGKFIWAKLYKENTWGAINWNGKTILRVLRLSKTELREFQNCGVSIKPHQLRFYQTSRANGNRLTVSEAIILADIGQGYYQGYFRTFIKLSNRDAVNKYILKQIRKGQYKSAIGVLTDWNDYMNECELLKIDFSQERYMFPNNLREAHMKTSKQIKFKSDPKIEKKIKERLGVLKEFSFDNDDLLIRPALSSEEIFEEGALQDICIGGYAGRYADGETDLFFIRKVSEPEKPFYAMEINKGQIRQCRGFGNRETTEDVQKFVDAFVNERLKKISIKPQGVAV